MTDGSWAAPGERPAPESAAPPVAMPPVTMPPVATPPSAQQPAPPTGPPVADQPYVSPYNEYVAATAAPTASQGGRLADGEWHRMHPATPLLKGGVAFIVILGIVFANLRERIYDLFVPMQYSGDPFDYVVNNGFVGWLLLAIIALIIVLIGLFYVSWLMHSFRITNEVVEVRSGVLFRTHRKARLDRIQGINIVRPVFARFFGAAKLEINQAGQDANVQLTYLASAAADDLRSEILRLASGTRQVAAPTQVTRAGVTVVERRVSEFLAPEFDPNAVPAASIVKLHLGRLIGSLVLSTTTVIIILAVVVTVVIAVIYEQPWFVLFVLPMFLGFGGFYVNRFSKSLRYSIAGTPDGIRVGFGLLSTSNETLPPGRIHSIQVSQPLMWRGPDWWEIKVNRASHSSTKGAAGEANTTILPVGSRNDVRKVLELMLPELSATTIVDGIATISSASQAAREAIDAGLYSKGWAGDGFTNSPRRAVVLRWFSWRRNGFAITPGSLLLRKGAIWRHLIIVPQPRLQSVTVRQGPLLRLLGLAHIHLDTVSGPISADLGALDRDAAVQFFEEVARVAVSADQADTTHRWRAADLPV